MKKWIKKLRKPFAIGMAVVAAVVLVSVSMVPMVSQGGDIQTIGMGQKVITIGHEVYAAGTADYTCDGIADNVQVQTAMDALPATGGQLIMLAGNYNFAATVTRAISNVTVTGTGQATYLANDGITALFTAGGNNWVFSNLETDAGSINMGATTEWMWTNVDDGTYYAYRSPYGQSVFNDATVASLTDSGLTNGRIPIAGVGGLLSDDADLAFAGNTLTVTNIEDSSLTNGRVTLAGAAGLLGDDADLTFDGDSLQVSGENVVRGYDYVVAANNASAYMKAQADYVCDGVADDVQILAALNALNASGGRVVLTNGTFIIAANLTRAINNVSITGQGNTTILQLANGADVHVITVNGDGWTIKDLKIDGNNDNNASGSGIYVNNQDGLLVENVRITAAQDNGIYFYGNYGRINSVEIDDCDASSGVGEAPFLITTSNSVVVTNCIAHDNGDSGGFHTYKGNNITFTNCISRDNQYSSFQATSDVLANSTGIMFVGCISDGNADGSGIRFQDVSHSGASGCSVYNSAKDGVLISDAEHITCTGLTINTTTNHAFNIGGSKYVTIADNVGTGIAFSGVGSGVAGVDHIVITGNYFSSGWQSIYNDQSGDDWLINGNWLEYSGFGGCVDLINADDVIITNNRLHATNGFAVTLNRAALVRFLIKGNNWEGCGADLTIGASVTTIVIDNINMDGDPYLVDSNFVVLKTWVKHDAQNPSVRTIPTGSFVRIAGVFTKEVWNADGTDLLTVGYDADSDSLLTSYDLAAGGLGWQDISGNMGVDAGYMATARAIELYYTTSDATNLTTGETIVVLEVTQCPAP